MCIYLSGRATSDIRWVFIEGKHLGRKFSFVIDDSIVVVRMELREYSRFKTESENGGNITTSR
jgi:hypothetical protein